MRSLILGTVAFCGLVALSPCAIAQDKKDIVDTAVGAGQFKTLAKALTEAGLIDTLKGKGPFTVFAPTDAAFAKLPPGTLDALLKDKAKLTAVLTYHVVPGKVMAADVVKLNSAKTVQGSPVKITVNNGKVMVNQANVVKTDIETTNGVIHVIDAVILPPEQIKSGSVNAGYAPVAGGCGTTNCASDGCNNGCGNNHGQRRMFLRRGCR
ncbi:MAG: fasciclin domain-containing protein [Gemmataceae bacterium]|nr:fasciclin domain-containing protein [Gemmataceae bacterium]